MAKNSTAPAIEQPLIGLIVPGAAGEVPSAATQLYPRIPFIAQGLGLPSVSPGGYDQVIDTVISAAQRLAKGGATAISLMGTSLSFYRGAAFNRDLQQNLYAATGLPSTTMSFAILRGLRSLGLERVTLATAYIDDVNRRLTEFLLASGVQVDGAVGLGMTEGVAIRAVGRTALMSLCERALAVAPGTQGILLSCGGLRTTDVVPDVELAYGVPVVSSLPAGLWDVVRAAGLESRVKGFGRLLQQA